MASTQPIIFLVLRRMRMPLLVLASVYALSITGFVMIPGVDPDGVPYRMSFFHAFYFVSYMGSTIGFGELPHPFTDAQRMWTLFTIYATVIGWLYAIGTLISLLQIPAFRRAIVHNSFVRSARRLSEPFYLVCGAGDTGSMVIRALTDRHIRAVAVDIKQDAIDRLELEHLQLHVPSVCADASQSSTLLDAGLKHRYCAGVLALSVDDHVNLKIALTSKLLNPRLTVIARAETKETADNMASFGTDHVINPYDSFAQILGTQMASPDSAQIRTLLTAIPGGTLREPKTPPTGRWIVCGYGRFGKAVTRMLNAQGNTTTVIEYDLEGTGAPDSAVQGRGTEAVTLREAGIERADALVAATDDDTNNLSILMTAGELMPDLYRASRQNRAENDAIFRAAQLPMVVETSEIIASRILEVIMTPLTSSFLERSSNESPEWARSVLNEIRVVSDNQVPDTWVLEVNEKSSPALAARIHQEDIRLGDILRDPRHREIPLECKPLMLRRNKDCIMSPNPAEVLHLGDRILIAGRTSARRRMRATLHESRTLEYCVTGRRVARRWLWRTLFGDPDPA